MRKRAAPSCESPPHTRGDVGALFGQSNRSINASTGSGVRCDPVSSRFWHELVCRTTMNGVKKQQAISPLAPPPLATTQHGPRFHSDTHIHKDPHAVMHGLNHASTRLFFLQQDVRIVIFGLGDSSGWTAMASRARLVEVPPVYEHAAARPHTWEEDSPRRNKPMIRTIKHGNPVPQTASSFLFFTWLLQGAKAPCEVGKRGIIC